MSALTELGQVLREEHFHILVSICGLENRVIGPHAAHPLDPDRMEDRQQLEDLIYALDDLLGHHAFEELVLFPLIRGSGGSRQMTRILAHEHCAIEPMAARLRRIAVGILDHGIDGQWTAFREAATQLAGELMHHLQKEELNIVQQMDRLLDSETDHRLAIRLTRERAGGKRTCTANIATRPKERDAPTAQVAQRRLSPAAAAARNAARRRSTSIRQPSP
jgi:hemerythrin-like domain-containing protein